MSVLYNDVQMDQSGSQETQNFDIILICFHYQDIYNWISPFNS